MAAPAEARIVVVDDDYVMREYLQNVLLRGGLGCTAGFESGNAALCYLASTPDTISLILSDINMPGMSGVELLRTVKAVAPWIPLILISGLYERAEAVAAVHIGAAGYLLKPALPGEIASLVREHLRGALPDLPPPCEQKHGAQPAVHAAIAASLHTMRLPGGDPVASLVTLFATLGVRGSESLPHSQRVAAYSRLIGAEYGLGSEALEELEIGALLHDVGNAAIPHNLLVKPDKLTDDEWAVMKTHSPIGADLLNSIPDGNVDSERAEVDIVRCHHEKVDGSGYPGGLVKDQIPILARIFAVADALDAICSDRPYRRGSPAEVARHEIDRSTGSHFDPAVVAAFRRVTDLQLEEVRRRFPDRQATPAGLNLPPTKELCGAL